jgi:predicted AlkP superfamily phosphohydrolase/phosphomutase
MYKMAKFVPYRKVLRRSSYLIDKHKSLAYTSELFGANPFGGIEVKKGDDYEELREQIIEEIKRLNEFLKKNIIKWVKRREELYRGKYLCRYPDIIFELNEEYGINWDLFVPLTSENYTHRKISGGHKKETVFAIWPRVAHKNLFLPRSIVEIKDLILRLLKR